MCISVLVRTSDTCMYCPTRTLSLPFPFLLLRADISSMFEINASHLRVQGATFTDAGGFIYIYLV
jgi:hypothetical protein